MKFTPRTFFVPAILFTFVFLACHEDNPSAPPANNNGSEVPGGTTRLYGNIRDANGEPIAGVALHVVYPVGAEPANRVFIGSDIFLFDTAQVLTSECNGVIPLPDGTPVKIYWDANNNNLADDTDPQPPLCPDPPNCPPQTVNFIEFPINGAAALGLPGGFYVENDFNVIGQALEPNRFYLRVLCPDGGALWTSEMVNVPQGPSEYGFHAFVCTPCSGTPGIPVWALVPAYPNPTLDSASVNFSLQQAAPALFTLRQLSNGRTDTLVNQTLPAGTHVQTLNLADRANGLYECRFSASTFAETTALLKNESDHSVLRVTPEIALTLGDGTYRFDTAGGVSIDRRGANNENLGTAVLDRVRLIALKSGYADLDTTFAITSAESLQVNLTLHVP